VLEAVVNSEWSQSLLLVLNVICACLRYQLLLLTSFLLGTKETKKKYRAQRIVCIGIGLFSGVDSLSTIVDRDVWTRVTPT